MKRALIWVSIGLTVSASLWAHKTIRPQIDANEPQFLKVRMCDLYNDPLRYAGKLVEFRAVAMGRRLDDLWIEDFDGPTCDAYMRIVAVFPEQVTPKPPFSFIGNEAFRRFASSIRGIGSKQTLQAVSDPGFVWREKKRSMIADVAGLRDKDYAVGLWFRPSQR